MHRVSTADWYNFHFKIGEIPPLYVMIKMKNMKYHLMLFAALLLMISSCSKNRLKGEGGTISETRTVTAFNSIECNGSNEVRIYRDSVFRVVVTGYQNLVGVYESNVSGGKLQLGYDDKYFNVRNDNISVEVYTPELVNVALNGSGNVRINSGFEGVFGGEINGSGNMYLSGGDFTRATYRISGSGNISARNAVADTAYATISGSGNIEFTVVNYLVARISGSGNIDYWGSPVADMDISGSGRVKKW